MTMNETILMITDGKFSHPHDLKSAIMDEYAKWESKHPVYFHSYSNHIEPMVRTINNTYSGEEQLKYVLFAWFHDFRYDVRLSNDTNVELAIEGMKEFISEKCDIFWDVAMMIRDTLYDSNTMLKDHIALDLESLITNENCERNEILVYKEHTNVPFNIYKQKRIEVLNQLEKNINESYAVYRLDIQHRIEFLKSWSPKIGIFAGSFNPFHIGHYDVFKQASKMFDIVIIANGKNADKDATIDPRLPHRLHHVYHTYDGWLMEFAHQFGKNASIVRGLRNGFDLDYEQNFKKFYYENGGVGNFVYLISSPDVNHVSSSAIRSLQKQFGAVE